MGYAVAVGASTLTALTLLQQRNAFGYLWPAIVTGLLAPVVVALVWLGLRRLRRELD